MTAVMSPSMTSALRVSRSSVSGTLNSGSPSNSPFRTETTTLEASLFALSTIPTSGGSKLPKLKSPKTTIMTMGNASVQNRAARSRKNILSSAIMNAW